MAATLLKKEQDPQISLFSFLHGHVLNLPQELVELQFLGVDFMITRLILTIIFVIIMGYIIEIILERNKQQIIEENGG